MGTIDLRAANENSIVDLSSQVHQLPCCIRFNCPSEVFHYFKPQSSEVEIDGVRTEEAHFRGRRLHGATISLPSGYSGIILFSLVLPSYVSLVHSWRRAIERSLKLYIHRKPWLRKHNDVQLLDRRGNS